MPEHWISHNRKELFLEELTTHLKLIIKEQKKREIPSKSIIDLLKRKDLPLLENKIEDLKNIDTLSVAKSGNFEEKSMLLLNEREAFGISSWFADIQPISKTIINKLLIGIILDVCLTYKLETRGTEFR